MGLSKVNSRARVARIQCESGLTTLLVSVGRLGRGRGRKRAFGAGMEMRSAADKVAE